MTSSLCRFRQLPLIARSYHSNHVQPQTKKVIDLRSDTVTKPSPGMLDIMLSAQLGDDVYKEDPTINQLESQCASLFGMEKALFVPSGTMGNLLCIMSHCGNRGEELIIGSDQHVYGYEQGHFMQFAGVPAKVIPNEADGTLCLKRIRQSVSDGSDFHSCTTKLICLENTHMRAGGVPLSFDYLSQVGEIARSNGIKLHIDGARLYNAAVALECSVKDLLVHADSVSMCLSKGLGCPVGSVIAGDYAFISRAQRIRKALGGGLRQSGILAAAGLYALENARQVLAVDHANAKLLAQGIKNMNYEGLLDIDVNAVHTNILFLKTKKDLADKLSASFSCRGLLTSVFDSSTLRLVTHLDVNERDIRHALDIMHASIKDEFVQ